MLSQLPWMKGLTGLDTELRQAEEEGRALTQELRQEAEALRKRPVTEREAQAAAERIYEAIQALPLREGYSYLEPSDLEGIQAARPAQPPLEKRTLSPEELYDRIYGGWLGRCGGCLLGQPVEGWHRERILGLLRESGNLPVKGYISSDLPAGVRERYQVTDEGGAYGAKLKGWINNVASMPEDDDTNYTVLALKLLEDKGPDFTPEDVAECWLTCLPLLHTCTAERAAYINLANLLPPPLSAQTSNPYREWIGAQIRGDLFGYVRPGDPEGAAALAWRDASISHVKNGIYGEIFAAAMIAAAFVEPDPAGVVRAGLAQVPERSRLAESIRQVLSWREDGVSRQDAIDRVHQVWDEKQPHCWCHTISNAMLVAIGLLYGNGEYAASVEVGLISGFDTDCNAATIGSIVGVMRGAKGLPEEWTAPLHDTLKSGVDGFGVVKISDLARRTAALASCPAR